jgi:hypothetical protein
MHLCRVYIKNIIEEAVNHDELFCEPSIKAIQRMHSCIKLWLLQIVTSVCCYTFDNLQLTAKSNSVKI